ncbi:hypothetical protein C8Q73DRAFT_308198 [Cubamyces lactineus]|nr:hypothetical protein C8Q73DRAFT_308198 [Cubamyces lactineus]
MARSTPRAPPREMSRILRSPSEEKAELYCGMALVHGDGRRCAATSTLAMDKARALGAMRDCYAGIWKYVYVYVPDIGIWSWAMGTRPWTAQATSRGEEGNPKPRRTSAGNAENAGGAGPLGEKNAEGGQMTCAYAENLAATVIDCVGCGDAVRFTRTLVSFIVSYSYSSPARLRLRLRWALSGCRLGGTREMRCACRAASGKLKLQRSAFNVQLGAYRCLRRP